jgi:hypothetical protein
MGYKNRTKGQYLSRKGGNLEMKYINFHKYLVITLAILLVAVFAYNHPASAAIIDGADQGGRPLSTSLTGGSTGDPDGSGTAFITLNYGQSTVCYEITVENIGTVTAAHIHHAPAGSNGPIAVVLTPPTSGFSSGCATVDRSLIMEMLQSPSDFYVNIHTTDYPAGALRGQLEK